jgi:hypothetical protein
VFALVCFAKVIQSLLLNVDFHYVEDLGVTPGWVIRSFLTEGVLSLYHNIFPSISIVLSF